MTDSDEKYTAVLNQIREAKQELPSMITCGCGVRRPIRFMFRCYFCGEFYCQDCAAIHFGQNREDYLKNEAELELNTKEKPTPLNGDN
jgi:hypothetical protein